MTLPPFQAFLDSHGPDVHRFCIAAVGPDDADDCFQETFIAALRAYPRLRPDSNLRSWVLTIAHRKTVDTYRRRRRRPVPAGDHLPEPPAPPERTSADGEPELWDSVGGLPPKQRAAVLHRFVNDLAYADIAAVMDTSEDAARRNVHEGLKRLREAW